MAATPTPLIVNVVPQESWISPAVITGAVIALLGTIAVQLFIAPYVAGRERKASRWCQELQDLFRLVSGTLPDAVAPWDEAMYLHIGIRKSLEETTPEDRMAEAQAFLSNYAINVRAERVAVLAALAQMRTLVASLCRVAPNHKELRNMNRRSSVVRLHTQGLGWTYESKDVTDESYEKARSDYNMSLSRLQEVLETLDERSRPPSAFWSNTTYWGYSRRERIRGRIKAKRELRDPEPEADKEPVANVPTA